MIEQNAEWAKATTEDTTSVWERDAEMMAKALHCLDREIERLDAVVAPFKRTTVDPYPTQEAEQVPPDSRSEVGDLHGSWRAAVMAQAAVLSRLVDRIER